MWAWQPMEEPSVDDTRADDRALPPSPHVTPETQAPSDRAVARRPFDRSGFARRLWWELPKPDAAAGDAAAAAAAVNTLPLALELIGVTERDGVWIAALYDRQADRLRLVRQGDRLLDADVVEISREQVRLARHDGELVLLRRRPGS